MNAINESTIQHWACVAHLLQAPQNEAEYDQKVETLDSILDRIGDDEDHLLAVLADRLGDLIEAYDQAHRPMPEVSGIEALRYLMSEHGIAQSQLPEVGAQSVVSATLAGKRQLNWRQVRALSDRFGVSTETFRG
ncbi:helix-turn-helix domain-containing protein [Kushneria indalinina]|uniref:HTH-type transcriptional regulator/antitoxin HigA n=1 Tax=Kushneria indalinina DSM 14324 TaxID=1122140 RepID=A0A3D9DW14_9GAMM|nr:transcriptional regulator [Kushneria indalinina]REC94936.1 HTH-type transcriptional regulator/antitoxin HigA [Kushneria indalinina DSM 14324]